MKKFAILLCSLILILSLTSCSILLPNIDKTIEFIGASVYTDTDKEEDSATETTENGSNQNTQAPSSDPDDNNSTESANDEIDYVKLINTITTDTIKACVNIRTEIQTFTSNSTNLGSGVIFHGEEIKVENSVVGYHYYVLTNYHVVELPSNCRYSFTVSTYQGNEYNAIPMNKWIYDDAKIELCKKNDLAILEFECATKLKVIETAAENPAVNETLISIGQPGGQHNAITIGTSEDYVDTKLSGGLNMENVLMHNAPIDHGNSGGALINTDHKLVGINFAGDFKANGDFKCGYSIPIETVFQFINDFDSELYASLTQGIGDA